MAKKKGDSGVYRVTEIIGTSPVSWEAAAKSAVEIAAKVAARPAHRRSR
jgi:flavin-binding protein dodecin